MKNNHTSINKQKIRLTGDTKYHPIFENWKKAVSIIKILPWNWDWKVV